MNNENKSYLENLVQRLCAQKSRLYAFILSSISVIFSIVCLTTSNYSSMLKLYLFLLLLASAANIVFAIDTESKNKYASDILLGGFVATLLGLCLRCIQLGVLFSWKYFLAYVVFALVIILLIMQHAKNQGKKKLLIPALGIIIAYILLEVIRISFIPAMGKISFSFYRFAEIALFASYIAVYLLNRDTLESFQEKLGAYKTQIPSMKICVIIFVFIATISIIIGAAMELMNNKTVNTVSGKGSISQSSATQEPAQNKAANTVSGNTVTDAGKDVNISDSTPKTEMTDIALNQTASTEKYDFTLNKVTFSYRVQPDNPPSWYTYYDAPEEQVYIYVNADVKNKQKQSIRCDEIYSVTADYNNGYTYTGFNIADDTDGDFTYANITSVEPLQTLGVHCLIACPQEVETSETPLFLTITLKDGTKFKYTIR